MNTIFKRLATVIVAFSLICLAADVAAKKPVKPPTPDPEPVDPGSLCADSGSFFPAFAYVFTGEIFLANAEGDCSISIYNEVENIVGIPSDISYRFFSDQGIGKVMWSERSWDNSTAGFTPSKIYLLEFQVEAGAITTPFPLAPKLILQEPEGFGNIFAPDLSPSGDMFIVSAFEPGETEGYIWEFDIPESGPANIDDKRQVAHLIADVDQGLEYATFYGPLYGLSDQHKRVYFGFDYPDRKFSYVEKISEGVWSDPILVAERLDGDLQPGSVGLWDFGNGLKEVLALSVSVNNIDQIEILDVDACVTEPDNCIIVGGIEGWRGASFTTFTEGPLPALLYLYDVDARQVGYSIRECDLDSAFKSPDACYRTVIDGVKNPKRSIYGVDSAD